MWAHIRSPALPMESTVTIFTVTRPDGSPAAPTRMQEDRPHVRLSASRIGSSTVVAAVGDVDAGNADDLAAYITNQLGDRNRLLLDLSGLDFFAIQGFSVLHDVDLTCTQRGIPWILVPSAEVSRVLRICDSRATLPAAPTVAAGLDALARRRRHLQLL
jgi:anti-anti-sigma factor